MRGVKVKAEFLSVPVEKPVIEVQDLTKNFGRFTAVNSVSFSIFPGEILGFLGPNGAGKTTIIKMMMGLLKITSGEVFIKDLSVRKHLKRIKRFSGYMSQKFSLYPLLTSLENVEFFGGISGLKRYRLKEAREELSTILPSAVLNQKVKDIPPGIRQQVALYTCLMTDPDVIFLDEPTSGVDPESRREFWKRIYKLKKEGKTLLVTTHNLDEAEFADRILILHQGVIVAEGEPEELLRLNDVDSMEELFKKMVGTED
jgi:ABC-2 type transport system ATP-binding protein